MLKSDKEWKYSETYLTDQSKIQVAIWVSHLFDGSYLIGSYLSEPLFDLSHLQ